MGVWGVSFRHFVAIVLLCVHSFSLSTFAHDWDPKARQPIREQANGCHVFLALAEPEVNDSVGVRLSSNRIEDFEAGLVQALRERGPEVFRRAHLFVTGVAKGDESKTVKAYYDALYRHGIGPEAGVKVRVLSIPRSWVQKDAQTALKRIWERVVHWFPSFERHYQSPLGSEVLSGLTSAALVEALNVVYLYQTLPFLDANLTVGNHATLLVVYSVFKKMMINWLLEPGFNRVESFLKQVACSLPFVANYNLFGKFSEIVAFYQGHGWQETLQQFPAEMLNFGAVQGLTLFLQTMFYDIVMTRGVRGWENRQEGVARSESARSFTNWVTIPLLAVDSVLLAMTANAEPWAKLGPMEFNTGHAALGLLTVVGSALWLFPKMLDPVFDFYEGTKSFFRSFFSLTRASPPTEREDRGDSQPGS